MKGSLAFTEADLRLAAGARSFERGQDYVDQVRDLEIAAAEITGTVLGSDRYRACLNVGEQGLTGACSCPHGQEGFFCKHCVGLGLAVLGLDEERIEEARAGWDALESWLESLSRDELLDELRRLLDEDHDLRRRLEVRAAAANADAVTVGRVVGELMAAPPYGEARPYVDDVHKAVAAIDDLIWGGGAAEAIGIAEAAIDLLVDAYQYLDDSSGLMVDAECELLAVHLRACQAAPPDPVPLGEYLAGLLLDCDYRSGPNLADYADLLGEPGTAVIRERIVAAYQQDPGNWRAKSLMESMAKADGDVDALVAVYAADLDDRGHNHLRIALALDEAGRAAEALAWAERGLSEAKHPDQRLVDYLADRYRAAGRDDDVLSLRRARFEAERTLASYQALRQAAMASGVWPAERDRALAELRQDARAARGRGLWAWNGPVLVDALIDDGELEAAWAAAADYATEDQWLRLADASAASRPGDALAVYLRVIGSLKTQTGDNVYRRMATLLLAARACHEALGTTDQFRRYLTLLRMECKRKRNLMAILDRNGL